MVYKVYDTKQGSFAIDWETCCQIIRSYHRSRLQNEYATEVKESQTSLNPLSWGLPDLTYVEVDWDKVDAKLDGAVLSSSYSLALNTMFGTNGVDMLVRELQRMQRETKKNNDRFYKRMHGATEKSMSDMEKSVETYRRWIAGAKAARDGSGSILIGAATVATGGATAAGLAGAGTIIKTVATWQDTGSVGAAAIEATTSVICTVVPVARGAKMSDAAKVLIGTAGDTGKELFKGESLATAAFVGSVNLVTGAAHQSQKRALKKL